MKLTRYNRASKPDSPLEQPPRAMVTLMHNSDRRSVQAALQGIGYLVRCTNDQDAAAVLLRSYEPNIIVVDIGDAYPTLSHLLTQVRRCPELYVIVCGANSDDQRITVLRQGADDAVSREISPDEIAARCQAILRRPRLNNLSTTKDESHQLFFGPLVIDQRRREVSINGHALTTTRLEFDLFLQLCLRPLEVCSRMELIESVWGPHWVGDLHVVDVHLSNLRHKLNLRLDQVQFIHTVRGIGFRLADDVLQLAARDLASSRIFDSQRS